MINNINYNKNNMFIFTAQSASKEIKNKTIKQISI